MRCDRVIACVIQQVASVIHKVAAVPLLSASQGVTRLQARSQRPVRMSNI